MQKLDHPNIVGLVDSYHTPGKDKLIIVIEFCKCKLFIVLNLALDGDLQRQSDLWKSVGKPVPEEFLLKWLRQILLGVSYGHSLDIIHQDLKPENIFLVKDGDIKIGDFGVSKVLAKVHSQDVKASAGTFHFMSPEAI